MPRPLLRSVLACAAWLVALAPAAAAPGDLDRGFASGGGFSFNVSEPDPTPLFAGRAVALPGGDALVAVQTDAGGRGVFGLVRITPGGKVDEQFGTNGLVTTRVGLDRAFARGIARQPDGKIVVAGTASDAFGPLAALARYTEDGRLDPTFGTGGIVLVRPGPDAAFYRPAAAVAVGPHGTIVTGGEVTDDLGKTQWLFLRLTVAGKLDPSFGRAGLATLAFPSADGPTAGDLEDVLVHADGRVVGIGTVAIHLALARLRANGTLDPTFGTGGLVPAPALGGSGSQGESVVPGPGGSYLVVGTQLGATGDAFLLARLTGAGALDATFGGGGTGYIAYQARGHASEATDLVVLGDGSILVAGTAADGSGRELLTIEKHRPNGTFDPSFLMGFGFVDDPSATTVGSFATGIVVHGGLPSVVGEALNPRAFAVSRIDLAGTLVGHEAVQLGGTLGSSMARVAGVAVGADASTTLLSPTNEGNDLLRLLANGTLDRSLGSGGVQPLPAGAVSALALGPGGRILVGGSASPKTLYVLARRHDGQSDGTFGTLGRASIDVAGATQVGVDAMLADPAGRTVLAGTATIGGVSRCLLARFLANGKPDPTFGSGGVALSISGPTCILEAIARTAAGYAAAGTVRESATVTRLGAFTFRANGARAASLVVDAGRSTNENGAGLGVAVQGDGRIVVTGRLGQEARDAPRGPAADAGARPRPHVLGRRRRDDDRAGPRDRGRGRGGDARGADRRRRRHGVLVAAPAARALPAERRARRRLRGPRRRGDAGVPLRGRPPRRGAAAGRPPRGRRGQRAEHRDRPPASSATCRGSLAAACASRASGRRRSAAPSRAAASPACGSSSSTA